MIMNDEGISAEIWDQFIGGGVLLQTYGTPHFFFSLLPSPLSHFLWDMITNDKGISSEIWDQFIGSDIPSIAF